MTLSTPDASQATTNPFDQLLLLDCQNDPNKIQARYENHRTNRNAQLKEKLLHKDFPGWQADEILSRLVAQFKPPNVVEDGTVQPFTDHRHNLNICARPPKHIKELVAEIQQEIRNVAPTLWFSPSEFLHITTLEISNSRTKDEIDTLATQLLQDGTASKLVNYTSDIHHRARLVKPILSYDASAMALSFLPAMGEPTAVGTTNKLQRNDAYSYHHLRRELAEQILQSGVGLGARYIVPSAHITIARFVSQDGFLRDGGGLDGHRVAALMERIERINETLREKYWPREDGEGSMPARGEWIVGQEQGLEFNKGKSWYGGGEKVLVGGVFE